MGINRRDFVKGVAVGVLMPTMGNLASGGETPNRILRCAVRCGYANSVPSPSNSRSSLGGRAGVS